MFPQTGLNFDPIPPDDLASAIRRVSDQVAAVAHDVAAVKQELARRRREIPDAVRRHHVAATGNLGGRCPCCGSREVIAADGKKASGAEYDHFYASAKPDAAHTWLICQPCHRDLTTGRIARDECEAQFRSYQIRRRRFVTKPPRLL